MEKAADGRGPGVDVHRPHSATRGLAVVVAFVLGQSGGGAGRRQGEGERQCGKPASHVHHRTSESRVAPLITTRAPSGRPASIATTDPSTGFQRTRSGPNRSANPKSTRLNSSH